MGRNWQLLPTTLASRSPRFVGYGVSYFGCYPGSTCSEHSIKYELTSLRLLQQIVSQTKCQRTMFFTDALASFKVQQTNYTQIGQTSKVKVSNSGDFSIRGLWLFSHLSLTRQAIGFTQLSTRMYSVPSLETFRVLEEFNGKLRHTGNPIRTPQGLGT